MTSDLFCKNIRFESEFHAWATAAKPTLHPKGIAKKEGAVEVIEAYHDTRTDLFQLENANSGSARASVFLNRLRADLQKLVPESFIKLYSTERLGNLIRYIRAIALRAQRGVFDPEKDQAKGKELNIHTHRLTELLNGLTPAVSEEKRKAIESFFWQIEEYKVSLFAQELGTSMPVSKKRLDTKFKEIERML